MSEKPFISSTHNKFHKGKKILASAAWNLCISSPNSLVFIEKCLLLIKNLRDPRYVKQSLWWLPYRMETYIKVFFFFFPTLLWQSVEFEVEKYWYSISFQLNIAFVGWIVTVYLYLKSIIYQITKFNGTIKGGCSSTEW